MPLASPTLDQRTYRHQAAFQHDFAAQWSDLARQVRTSLRLMALNGIADPLTDTPIAASSLQVDGPNFRESLQHDGLVSRQRAVLLLLRQLIEAGQLPRLEALRLYCPEAITPFAQRLRGVVANFQGSEYIPDPVDTRRQKVRHEDLCQLSFDDRSFDGVICNEILEHVYDLPAALRSMRRVLVPGGSLIGTVPFAYCQAEATVKALHLGRDQTPELLMEPEYHGDPVQAERGSLVYRIPGWEFLDQLRDAGFEDPRIEAIHSPTYGILGAEIPWILVFMAQRPQDPAPAG
ncbi:class I SAM-dependent methyltransferase [Cyanobium sp. AMD-g]|uniref:class I SAM-dependent methyltransferase n=1 Tax=Cyanobium sp. AMD-g TaxID=2823699 RepID=UPI0020CF93E0|nr:class I SAM-dependent methyltransferase [Cyanobium sp. AMD-g]MCP9931923.1 class I SAM-dependent methyltransferase [Cyanobium sp. AMD-g]